MNTSNAVADPSAIASAVSHDTPNPSEHYDSARTSLFRGSRTLEEMAGAKDVALNARYTSGHYPKLYNVSTVWRDAATGEEIARAAYFDPNFNGSTVSPGFDGRFYYLAQTWKAIVELTPVPSPQG